MNLYNYIAKNSSEIFNALWQHILLSLIASIIAILIAIPIAIWLKNHKKAGNIFLQICSVIQTIPSLAILGILIPFVGIGTVPAVIALVLYALLPIYSNTYTGLTSVDPLLIEAADALGLDEKFKLLKVELPQALPLIMTGIRNAIVMIIGTATLAALIGGGGLGTYILLGIQTNNNNALLVGAILSAILTLITSFVIRIMSHLSWKKNLSILITVLALFGGYNLYQALAPKNDEVIIAGKMGGEPEILINMYKDLIQHQDKNIKVTLKPNFGGTSFLFSALKNNKIDIYPEFTGTVLQSLVNTTTVPHNPQKAYNLAKEKLSAEYQMSYLKPMNYQNGYALAIRTSTAKRYYISTFSDLAKHSDFKAAFDPDFYQQKDGYPGLQKTYGINFNTVKTMEPGLRYQALANKKIDITDGYTTDPQIKQYNLTMLQDNLKFFPPYQGAPLMSTKFAKQHPKIVQALNRLANKITTKQMQAMNYQVSVKHKKASQVAYKFLKQHHYLD